ncbi:sulfite oxidase-like oxidoreductase [Staphylothermus hellenicus]|uniref:Oxidoreductase molybdopterin binding protein n=1 Tax=Staphylothermus hellenicus (strain DSM 12710 / JCM 10830 / BK20S6-10-b1 / P8) TaxID=591019 RepID=D7D8T2_STAHD|nr:sulfite oxidase-like oxidoreductase [Staphylothermus hellenicus]ADI32178.1 oxidoreductase molybdopterin binding protein [Staphylothermus hellenicus DSM 12710]
MNCVATGSPGLFKKGIVKVIQCFINKKYRSIDYSILKPLIWEYLAHVFILDNDKCSLEFVDNEPVNDEYIIYRYHLNCSDRKGYIGIRAVTRKNKLVMIVFTIGKKYEEITKTNLLGIEKLSALFTKQLVREKPVKEYEATPPGQRFIPGFIIYRILGQPYVRINEWSLKITGEVEKQLEYTYKDLLEMEHITIKTDFHCVTGWSVKDVEWTGVQLKRFAEEARVKPGVRWVYIVSLDGYTTIVPYEDFVSDKSILALKMNNESLPLEQGFPARIIIPHLYGWKSAKWVGKIIFTDKYVDGYWEALGYHWRGNIYLNERFKQI